MSYLAMQLLTSLTPPLSLRRRRESHSSGLQPLCRARYSVTVSRVTILFIGIQYMTLYHNRGLKPCRYIELIEGVWKLNQARTHVGEKKRRQHEMTPMKELNESVPNSYSLFVTVFSPSLQVSISSFSLPYLLNCLADFFKFFAKMICKMTSIKWLARLMLVLLYSVKIRVWSSDLDARMVLVGALAPP